MWLKRNLNNFCAGCSKKDYVVYVMRREAGQEHAVLRCLIIVFTTRNQSYCSTGARGRKGAVLRPFSCSARVLCTRVHNYEGYAESTQWKGTARSQQLAEALIYIWSLAPNWLLSAGTAQRFFYFSWMPPPTCAFTFHFFHSTIH